MPITSISLKRTFSLGNYETETLGISYDMDSHENPAETLRFMQEWINTNRTKQQVNGYINHKGVR